MPTRAGVGFSELPNSQDAGREVAAAAAAALGEEPCHLAILYSTSKHDPAQLRDGVRSVIGPGARLTGGYAIGVITNDRLGYEGYQVGLAALSSDSIDVDLFIERGLADREYDVGVALGRQITGKNYVGTPNILLMYDSIRSTPT